MMVCHCLRREMKAGRIVKRNWREGSKVRISAVAGFQFLTQKEE